MKLKTLVSIVLLIILMVFFFMGQYYQSLGDTVSASTMTLIVFVLMGALALGATASRQREGSFSNILHIIGIIIGIIYLAVGGLFVVPMSSHFFYVNGEKQNIQVQADTVISRTNEMLAVYKKMADNRAQRLEQDLINSQYTPAGLAEFEKAYPQKQYNSKMPSTERIAFGNRLLTDFNNIKNEWETTYSIEFTSKLAQDWSALYAPENSQLLAKTVKEYSKKLQDAFQNSTTPFERLRGEHPVFDKGVTADYIVNEFACDKTSSVWNVVLFILLILSAASFFFVQSTHVKTQTKKDPIFDLGHDI